jgi:hypothetical protein
LIRVERGWTSGDGATQRGRGGGDRRSPFERFVEQAELRVSQAPFFFVCAGIVVNNVSTGSADCPFCIVDVVE